MRKWVGNIFFWLQFIVLLVVAVMAPTYCTKNNIVFTVGLIIFAVLMVIWMSISSAYKVVVIKDEVESKFGIVPVIIGIVTFIVGLVVFNPPATFSNVVTDIVLPAVLLLFFVIDLVDFGVQATCKA